MVEALCLVFAGIAIGVMLMSVLQRHAKTLRSWLLTRQVGSSGPGKRPPVAVMRYEIDLQGRKRGRQ